MKRLKLFIPLLVFVLLAGFLYRALYQDPRTLPSALLDKPFPAFSLPSLGENQQTLDASLLKGDVTLVNVWATWCPSCHVEHPFLLKLAQQMGVRIVGINYKDDTQQAKQWLVKLGNPYQATVVDETGDLGIELGVYGAPETYIVDQQGIIRYKHIGVVDERVWQESLLPIVKQLQAKGDPS
ncbi:DsbE family thiol:disulfide interchange protein [Zooshikella marina]|uniref:DsbE family thiol:disulfide interchange protein n=1 Tax=Zooshikella ganghwensis TaxID=202772 RepID=A0A4P9VM36_9GAMM|nr:DsbE family thiol:disulfide interchange protein [Zooshikella ganghwensis]MBU2707088.1 DsbE family thiol:disulfide interchange protein [Zooshikella ganghwensis]RDH43444.1 DsbE family thiol:disulfide interchange protein [Zooshikella ganghwensis]